MTLLCLERRLTSQRSREKNLKLRLFFFLSERKERSDWEEQFATCGRKGIVGGNYGREAGKRYSFKKYLFVMETF